MADWTLVQWAAQPSLNCWRSRIVLRIEEVATVLGKVEAKCDLGESTRAGRPSIARLRPTGLRRNPSAAQKARGLRVKYLI